MKTALSLSLAIVLLSSQAWAQPSDADIERYKTLTTEAAQTFEGGDFRKTIELLSQARVIHDHPDLSYNIGRSYEAMSWCNRARETFSIYVKRDDVSKKDRSAATQRLDSLKDCVEKRLLTVECEPAETTLLLNGETQLACATPTELTEGSYSVEASADGYLPSVYSVNINAFSDDISLQTKLAPAEIATVEEAVMPQDSSDWRPVTGWTLVGVGAGALVAGLVLDATSGVDSVEVGAVDQVNSDAESRRTAITALYIGGAVLGAAGAGILIWEMTDNQESASLSVHPDQVSFTYKF